MAEALPEGTVLFTDVEGSTDLTTCQGDEAGQEILRTQRNFVRQQVEERSGHEVKWLGAGLIAAFASARRKALRPIIFAVTAAAVVGGAASCGDKASEVSVTVQPSPPAEETTTPEAAITPETSAPIDPTPVVEDEYEGWLAYTNDVYGYEFRYPPEATVGEAEKGDLRLPTVEGLTFDELYERYTGKICVSVQYELGYVIIVVLPDDNFQYVPCGGTGRAWDGPDREESLVIDGRTYTAQGFEEQGPGETLDYHSERLGVVLDDGTRMEYGSGPADPATYKTATFEEYLQIRDQLLKIIQSYRKLP